MDRSMRVSVSKGGRHLGVLAATLLGTACAHTSLQVPGAPTGATNPDPYLEPRGATPEKPKPEVLKKIVCADPANFPPRAYDIPQLSAAQLMALFESPTNTRQLLNNVKLLSERDLLVQAAFFDDAVLQKFFGAAAISWEKTGRPGFSRPPHVQVAFGPTRVAHTSGLSGTVVNVAVRVVSSQTCMGWRQTASPPAAWWPPTSFDSGYMQIDVSRLNDLDVGLVKDILGADPDEAPAGVIAYEVGDGVSSRPGSVTYINHEKERHSAPFSQHRIELIPREGGERPRQFPDGDRRVFVDGAQILSINIVQAEREP